MLDRENKTMQEYKGKPHQIANTIVAIVFIIMIVLIAIQVFPKKYAELKAAVSKKEFTKAYSTVFENSLNNSFPLKFGFVDINGLMRRVLLQREMNDVILLKNGQEHMPMEDRSDEGIAANADSLKQLSDWLNEKGIAFLWCQVPQKVSELDGQLPAGIVDYSNRVADVFMQDLRDREVNCMDLRECMTEDGIDRYSLFLKTEHHWSPYGGFYAFQKICEYFRENFGEDIPEYVTDLENYEQTTYHNGSLGHYGQRTGWMFAGFDDFTLIYPKWETRQSSWAPHKELLREGSFYDAIFYADYLEMPWRERGLYATYIGGDWPIVVHHSETAPIDKTVMILIDSYGTVVESFLTTTFKNVIGLDLRWVLRKQIGKTTAEFVEEYQPDIVVVMFNPNQLGSPDSEQFQYGIESYRAGNTE
jgi:hypothetical protein